MRDAGLVMQSMQLPECFLPLSRRHCEASICFWLQSCWSSPAGSNKARSVNKRVYRKTQACTGAVYRAALLKIDWVQTWLPFPSISFATKREHIFYTSWPSSSEDKTLHDPGRLKERLEPLPKNRRSSVDCSSCFHTTTAVNFLYEDSLIFGP